MRLGNRFIQRSVLILASLLGMLRGDLSLASSINNELQTQMFQYASEDRPTLYISNRTDFQTSNFLTRVHFYFESGPQGTWSFDPDPFRFNFRYNENEGDILWIGREQPLNLIRDQPVEFTSALGSVWTQNSLEALKPRVTGWVGTGFVKSLDSQQSWKVFGAYSPIFLPSFGPSLGFGERGELNPNRYARLPPSHVNTGGVTVPIRYQLQIGQLSDLLLQHQGLIGIAHQNETTQFDVYAYSAPRPDPVPLTDAKLAVNASSVNAKVDINPQFPRESWMGTRIQAKKIRFQPAFEFLQKLNELSVHIASLTGYLDTPQLNPFVTKNSPRASFGVVTHFGKMFEAPTQSDALMFFKLPIQLTEKLLLSTLVQGTLLNARQSIYLFNELDYALTEQISILAAIRILSGQDNSYFGDWRSEDSFSTGVKWVF